MGFERRAGGVERLHRPGEITRDDGDFRFGNHAPRPGHGLLRAEATRCRFQKGLGAAELSELSHRDTAKRQGRRVVPQGDPLQRTEQVAGRQSLACRGNQRIHRNPVTLVTPPTCAPASIYCSNGTGQQRGPSRHNQVPGSRPVAGVARKTPGEPAIIMKFCKIRCRISVGTRVLKQRARGGALHFQPAARSVCTLSALPAVGRRQGDLQ